MAKRARTDPLDGLSNGASEIQRTELNLFVSPKNKDPILSTHEIEFTPIGSLDNYGPIIFSIPASTDFTDLSRIRLSALIRVQTSDGKTIQTSEAVRKAAKEKGDGVMPTPEISIPNDFFDCLFRRIILEVNSVRTGSDHHHHPQLSVLKNLLSYSESVANASLKYALVWHRDSGPDLRSIMSYQRFNFIENSQEVRLVSRFSHDLFNSTRLLPPGHTLKIHMDRSTPEFCLIRPENSTKDFKVKFEDLRLTIPRVRVADHIVKETEMHYKNGSPVYIPFTRTDARSFEIPKGTKYYKAQSLFSGTMPENAIFVFCEPDSLGSGNYSNNPVIFPAKRFKVSQVQFYVDEREVLNHPYKPDWESSEFQDVYQGLLKTMNLDVSVPLSQLSYTDFENDYAIFAVSLRGFDGKESGNISVSVRFQDATTESVSGLLIPQFRSCLMIDSDKNVIQSDY